MNQKILKYIDNPNIAKDLDDQFLASLGTKVIQEYEIDFNSRYEWMEKSEKALAIARQIVDKKSFPWEGAANIAYPLITGACIQFASRAYPDILKGNDIVKGRVLGPDPTNAKTERKNRISSHMSYQLTEEMEEWEEDTDKLLHILPAIGECYRKSYFDPVLGRNVSKLVLVDNFVVNQNIKSLDTARRKTERVFLYANEVIEKQRAGLYLDVDLNLTPIDGDEQAAHEFYEQHRYLDLDDDGYEEPYIVTVHKDTEMVVRITAGYGLEDISLNAKDEIAAITQVQYYTKYGFIPDPGGGFLHFGFGQLLYPLNDTINTTINQLLDAGTLHNTMGGFVTKGFKVKGGTFSLAPNEWKMIDMMGTDLKSNILPLPVRAPSNVLFQLLGFIVDAGQRLAAMADVLSGEGQPNTPATTTLALIEQGLKVYSAIYKRIFRSMKAEFKKLYRLNSIYLEDLVYFTFQDTEQFTARQDYAMGDVAVAPVADPNATDIQRLMRAQALMSIPGLNPQAVQVQFLQALKYSNEEIKELMTMPEMPPDPKVVEMQIKAEQEMKRIEIQEAESISRIDVNKSTVIKNLADAEAKEIGPQLDLYMQKADQLHQQMMAMMDYMTQGQQQGQPAPEQLPQPEMPQGAEIAPELMGEQVSELDRRPYPDEIPSAEGEMEQPIA